jgi:ferredoxin-NADP reductase/MOSC domain-containing protein YiiM
MARLLSVNVGLPRDISWQGRTVHTGIWKDPVRGRCRARRLNLEGDGQGDLAGHGGEHRAVFVYQLESYRHWEEQLRRPELVYGQLGENFTVEGLPDDAVCIGDRYRIGSALLEVTQPRVTCYRVGIRMNEPRMPALLTGSGRPGFYFRVLQEGDVGAGDEIVKVGQADDPMTVAEINALLYSAAHPRDRLERARRIAALSPGWRTSFEALLRTESGASGALAPEAAAHPVAPGFRPLTVAAVEAESADVLSFTLESGDGQPLTAGMPGQYVIVRLRLPGGGPPLFRSYSLSGPRSTQRQRISVKIEPDGVAGGFLKQHAQPGDVLEVSAPRGSFVLLPGPRPVVLLSAGIGATPVLAMLHALAAPRSDRQVLWLHQARDGKHHPFAAEARQLLRALPHGRSCVCYSRPRPGDTGFDVAGRLSRALLERAGIPAEADAYLCGPARFMDDMRAILARLGVAPQRTHVERFGGGESLTPGVLGGRPRAPHPPAGDTGTGSQVSFARSGVAARFQAAAHASILELAEVCDVPVRWACRTGVCHSCECGLVSGVVRYQPEPLERPAPGNVLICCSQPDGDVVVDL